MAKRELITLGNKTFRSRTEAAKYVRKLMEGYDHGEYIVGEDFGLVLDVIKRFPDANKKIGPGVQNIILQVGIGTDRYFLICCIDNTWDTCGYKSAFFPKSDLDRFRAACREVTGDGTYGSLAFPMGKPPCFEVHHVKQFEEVVDDFIGLYNIDVSKVNYRQKFNRKPTFKNRKLEQRVMEYFRQFAVLRLLSKEEHEIETAKQRRSKKHDR